MSESLKYELDKAGFEVQQTGTKGKFLNVVGMIKRKNKLYFEVLESKFNTDMII